MTAERRSDPGGDQPEILCKVPVFRPVAIRLLSLLQNEDVDIFEVAGLLGSDPGFSAEVLTLANSVVYSLPRRVNTVERAIIILGIERTRTLATRAALQGMMRGLEENAAVQNCWTHSRATAILAGWLAPLYRLHPDRAYTAALMHDIGRLGLLAGYTAKYAELLTRATGNTDALLEAERLLFSVDHCEAGLWLTRTWGLPEEFWETAAHHHEPVGPNGAREDLIRVSCSLAQAMGFKAAPNIESEPVDTVAARIPETVSPRSQLRLVELTDHLNQELSVDGAMVQ